MSVYTSCKLKIFLKVFDSCGQSCWCLCVNYTVGPCHWVLLLARPFYVANPLFQRVAGLSHWFPFPCLPRAGRVVVSLGRVANLLSLLVWPWGTRGMHFPMLHTRRVFWASGSSRKIIAPEEWSDVLGPPTLWPISLGLLLHHILCRT